ncbi:MAG: tRNA (adenosine(37)-N6)-threonylcarbamoyltransferase complex ATPase subunit type 1 TsaE [Hyphomonas sp.]
MTLILDCPDEASLRALGGRLAGLLKVGDVIALHGDLGAGKTTFSRGLIEAFAGVTDVPSPTYTLVQTYDSGPLPVWHYDLYRLEDTSELVELGWDETADGVALVEWPERAGAKLPKWRLDLTIEFLGEGRRVTLEPHGEGWQTRLHGF